MMTWKQGRAMLSERLRSDAIDLHPFLDAVFSSPPTRVSGTAVFLNADAGSTPNALLHNLKHNKVLHKQNLFVTVKSHEVPWIKPLRTASSWKTWARTAGKSCCTWASRMTPMCQKH
jgi:KUP system potassium uptake protein